ncbi:MAG: hypothetical protein KDE03_17950 [Rhodobacteraceae bacterium]|nr:hypothetical protein [Paracoccaceae bacterium]
MKNSPEIPGLLHLLPLNGRGDWLHMCIHREETPGFLMDEIALDDLIVDALVEEDTRSRIRVRDDGIMVLLKAMHLRGKEMARPEDMVSMRLWVTPERVVSTREADIDPILELTSRVAGGEGPATPGGLLADLIEEHLDEVESQVEMLEDDTNEIGRMITLHQTESACPNMAETETRISGFLRHLGPQRPVLEVLAQIDHPVLSARERVRLDDSLNRLLRFLETLQNLRERIEILNDQVTRIQDRQLNRSSYAFAAAATIFLPLGFVTGLFGVNLGGIPYEHSASGFWIFVIACVVVALAMFAFFRWRKWL